LTAAAAIVQFLPMRDPLYLRLLLARDLLYARYSERLPLRELAAAARLSEFRFLRWRPACRDHFESKEFESFQFKDFEV
jgi:hypothetical protein